MYKKAISILSILFSIILFFCSIAVPVSAHDIPAENTITTTEITPRFVNIASTSASLDISGLNATMAATLISYSSMTLKIKVELQKEKSSGYETIETWTESGFSNKLVFEKTRLINVLSNYRIKVTYTAGSESIEVYRYPA